MTVHLVQSMKREDQQDAIITSLLLMPVSTCIRHHYAHLQENKGPVTAFGVLFWFCWMWLVAVVGCCLVVLAPSTLAVTCQQSNSTFG